MVKLGADKFIVDLILHIGQENEGSNHTLATAGLQTSRGLAIPHIAVAGNERADRLRRHREQQAAVGDLRCTASDPVIFAGITEIIRLIGDSVKVVELERTRLADRLSNASIKRVRLTRIATAETVRARAALPILCWQSAINALTRARENTHGSSKACPWDILSQRRTWAASPRPVRLASPAPTRRGMPKWGPYPLSIIIIGIAPATQKKGVTKGNSSTVESTDNDAHSTKLAIETELKHETGRRNNGEVEGDVPQKKLWVLWHATTCAHALEPGASDNVICRGGALFGCRVSG